LLYEWSHLLKKLEQRNEELLWKLEQIVEPEPHPLFEIVKGEIESWEAVRGSRVKNQK